jgi:hypothetical protein
MSLLFGCKVIQYKGKPEKFKLGSITESGIAAVGVVTNSTMTIASSLP